LDVILETMPITELYVGTLKASRAPSDG